MLPGANESFVSLKINNVDLATLFDPIVKIIASDSASFPVRFIDPVEARNRVVWVGMIAGGLANAGYSDSQKYVFSSAARLTDACSLSENWPENVTNHFLFNRAGSPITSQ